ncbi:MAG: hypothetical protein ACR2L9_11835 [Solirubrobacteraceae bacterium]
MARLMLTRGELVATVSAGLLFISMFALEWFGVVGIPGRTRKLSYAVDGWQGLPLVRWVILLTVLATICSALLHVSQRGHGAKTDTGWVIAALSWLTVALLIYRVLIELPAQQQVVDQKIGSIIGLSFALGVALGASDEFREERLGRRPRALGQEKTSEGVATGRYL